MCTNIEIDINDETLEILTSIAKSEIQILVKDECSATIFDEATINTYEELEQTIGKTVLNSIIVNILVEQIERMKIEEGEEDE